MLAIDASISDVGTGIGLVTKDLNNYNTGRIKKCLKNLGWEEYRPEGNDGRVRKWRKS